MLRNRPNPSDLPLPANAVVDYDGLGREQADASLDLFFCRACTQVERLAGIDSKIPFENYIYVSGTSSAFVKHFVDDADAEIEVIG